MPEKEILYGVDLNAPITPRLALDAITECFFQAHCEDTSIKANENENKDYCRLTIKKAFTDSGGDFDNPTKESILRALDKLQEFSRNFRDTSIIKKHTAEIMRVIDKIP